MTLIEFTIFGDEMRNFSLSSSMKHEQYESMYIYVEIAHVCG